MERGIVLDNGWVKLHRKLLDNPIFDNPNLLKMWIWCLLKATHQEYDQMVGLQKITLKKGQFITGRFKGSEELKLNPSTFYKHLKTLQAENLISLNSNNKITIVTIEKWGEYQTEQNKNINRITTKEQQNNTNKNNKNIRNNIYSPVVEYLNQKTGKKFRATSTKTKDLINARVNEGFKEKDFYKVIDIKVAEWKGNPKMELYLRPETLFSNKFEGYLNQNPVIEDELAEIRRIMGGD